MSAIKDKIQWYQHLVDANREKGLVDASLERDLDVTKEISDQLDAINEIAEMLKAHSASFVNHANRLDRLEKLSNERCVHIQEVIDGENCACGSYRPVSVVSQSPLPVEVPPPSTLYTGDTERSCRNCNLLVGCKVVLSSGQDCCDFWEQYVPRPKQPAQEQLTGRADGLCPKCMKPIGATTLCPFCGEHFEPYTQEQGVDDDFTDSLRRVALKGPNDDECYDVFLNNAAAMIDDLRARLEQAEAKVKELTATMLDNGELAIRRGKEIERLEKEQGDILFLVQTRLQPPGSPCPGGPVMLVTWITGEAVKKIERLEKENAELKNQPIAVRCVDKKCDDCPIAPIEIFNKLRAENAELKRKLSEVKP